MEGFIEKAKKIRLLILDVDGVLTSGALIYGKNGEELKKFHVHDGQGIKLLHASGVEIAIITARSSEIVSKRAQDLGITRLYQGQNEKLPAYEDLKQKLKLTDEQIAYVGDDVPDLPIFHRVGLAITVANAPKIMHKYAYWVTTNKGGKGAVREICDLIMEAQGTFSSVMDTYLKR